MCLPSWLELGPFQRFVTLAGIVLSLVALPKSGAASEVLVGTASGLTDPRGRVLRYAGGQSWEDLSVGVPFETVWDLEWHEGRLWACGRSMSFGPLVARWDGASWTQWGGAELGGLVAAALAVVQDDLYLAVQGRGLLRLDDDSWTLVAPVSPVARMQGDECRRGEPLLTLGSDASDDFWAYDPSGAMPCGAACPSPSGGPACAAGCFAGSCIHSMALHDDGMGPTAHGGAYEGAVYRWSAAARTFEALEPVPGSGHVQALASFRGRLLAGTSNAEIHSKAATGAWVLEESLPNDQPISALAVDPEADVLWVGHGGVPFAFARTWGTSMVRTWDGDAFQDRGTLGEFGLGVPALLVVSRAAPSSCDAGPARVVDCSGVLTPVQLSGTAAAASGCGVGEPLLTWHGDFVEGSAQGASPTVHFAGPGVHAVVLQASGGGVVLSCETTITVRDVEPPSITAPPSLTLGCAETIPPPSASASDACDPSPVLRLDESVIAGGCPQSRTIVRTWTSTDASGNVSTLVRRIEVVDDVAPSLWGVPADERVPCEAVPPPASPVAQDECDPSPSIALEEVREDGACPGAYRLRRTWTATDACGNASARTQVLDVVDSTPPTVDSGDADVRFLWPPNHRMVTLDQSAFVVSAADACSGPVTWRYVGCASDQPDDGLGDGHSSRDCQVAADGTSIAVRAERQGGVPSGRRYAVSVVATDSCGNASSATVVGHVRVAHDRR